MKIFVINLARSQQRRAFIEKQLLDLKLDYEIFEAVDGSQLSYTDIMKDTKVLNYALGCGEIGCALSHINVYRKIVSENIEYALVIEDDALLSKETPDILDWIESQSVMEPTITLLTETTHYLQKTICTVDDTTYSTHKVLEAACSHGYVVNFQAALKLIEFLYPVWMVADKWQALMEYSICNVEAVIPPVISNKTLYAESSTIRINKDPVKWIEQKKNFIWKELKKRRPFKVKFKRFLWASFVYPFLKISK